MLLTVDIGNTNTVLDLWDGAELTHSWRVTTDQRTTADEMAVRLNNLCRGTVPPLTGIAVCSTVPAAQREIRLMISRYYPDVPALTLDAESPAAPRLAVDRPGEVGSDRIANVLAAHHLYGGPTVVVDFGTSTNFDVVGSDGEFLGGVLTPGIAISMDALAANAARLRKVEAARPPSVIGRNTEHCLQSGLVYGFAAQIDGVVGRIVAELGVNVAAVIATGGLAPVVIAESAAVTAHEPHLTSIGLRVAFDRVFSMAR
ncbi:pantothenate kinase [Krasilnikovia cinnamomea]|uniref:Type III pantothenate kinase n=1 Tax=Krasilnikovia cinnamomea TaxID=349313 RepID=A0A4Q7ZJ89_9ACTN|nr:type III pantothenate kinase [Krasilnikovia cinnamomea]RZU50940.1 pantothenate kinase [Krasilnikovia cinnamomea]